MESGFWKKYGIIISSAAVIAFVISITNLPTLLNIFRTINDDKGDASFQQVQQAGSIAMPSVAREVLTRDAVIVLTNKARADNGLPLLAENQLLNSIAEARAKDMLEKQYFDHVSPTGQQASDIAQSIGYAYKVIAENIGSGDFYTNQKIVDGWMQSPGHRNNILSTDVQEIGAAVLKGKFKGTDTYITVQIFGRQSPPVAQKNCVAPSENLLHEIEIKKAELESLQGQLSRLKNEINDDKEAIENDQRNTNGDPQKITRLNERISAYNERTGWYNRMVGETKAKAAVTESMVKEYNRLLQIYKECNDTH